MEKKKRYFLAEEDIPRYWYNIQADMVNKPMPPLNPATKQPLKPEDLYPIFAEELSRQELGIGTSLLLQEGGRDERNDRNRRGPMGSSPLLRRQGVRTGSGCLSSQNQLRAEALPPQHHADVRRASHRFPLHVHPCGQGHPDQKPELSRFFGHGHLGSHRTGTHDPELQIHARVGIEPRHPASDHHRPGSRETDGNGR